MEILDKSLRFILLIIALIGCVNCAKNQADCDPVKAKLVGDECVSPRGAMCLPAEKFVCQSGISCVLIRDPEKVCNVESPKPPMMTMTGNEGTPDEVFGKFLGTMAGGFDMSKQQTNENKVDLNSAVAGLEKAMNSLCVCKGSKTIVVSVGLLILTGIIGIFNS